MKIKKVCRVLLFMLSLCLLVSSCSSGEPRLTPALCLEQYEVIDPNLVYMQREDSVIWSLKDGRTIADLPERFQFYKIEGLSSADFLAGISFMYFMADIESAEVYCKKEDGVNPIQDYTVTKMELYWQKRENFEAARDNSKNFGEAIHLATVASTEDENLIRTMQECLQTRNDESYLKPQNGGTFIYMENSNQQVVMSVRLHFAETDAIVWDAVIFIFGDTYCVCEKDIHLNDLGGSSIILPDEVAQYIQETVVPDE